MGGWVTRGRTKRYILSCKYALPICYMCERVIKILFCTHAIPCDPCTNVPQYILSCAYALPLYFTCERAIRRILYFTHALQLYNLRQTLLTSNMIRWYLQHAVCTQIWDHAIFCAILYISARSIMIAYGKDPSIMSLTATIFNTCTLISAWLWTSPEPFPWRRCLTFAEECQPWRVWCHWIRHNDY